MLDLLETYKDFLNNIASRLNVMLYCNNSSFGIKILVIYERQTRYFFASLCLCHCLLTPALVLLMGTNVFLGYLEAGWVHKLLLLPVLIIALSSIPRRWLVTRNQWLLILTSSGLSQLLLHNLVMVQMKFR
jgi:hypothetical protein